MEISSATLSYSLCFSQRIRFFPSVFLYFVQFFIFVQYLSYWFRSPFLHFLNQLYYLKLILYTSFFKSVFFLFLYIPSFNFLIFSTSSPFSFLYLFIPSFPPFCFTCTLPVHLYFLDHPGQTHTSLGLPCVWITRFRWAVNNRETP
jgi:hypothetical protein